MNAALKCGIFLFKAGAMNRTKAIYRIHLIDANSGTTTGRKEGGYGMPYGQRWHRSITEDY